uniref:C-type lectin domain-containing protein n=1 Tax=Anas platyrhynchos platyrhynchos TaxID=8840 RepID=A0A493TFW2_ANAPP
FMAVQKKCTVQTPSLILGRILSNTGSSSPTEDSWKCCPEGWRPFQESCYYFSDDQMPWNESQQNCSGMGSQLVVINTEAEQVMKGLVTNTYETKYYMGLSAHKTGKWQWSEESPATHTTSSNGPTHSVRQGLCH